MSSSATSKGLKILIILACLAFFIYQFSFIYNSFKREETTIALKINRNKVLCFLKLIKQLY